MRCAAAALSSCTRSSSIATQRSRRRRQHDVQRCRQRQRRDKRRHHSHQRDARCARLVQSGERIRSTTSSLSFAQCFCWRLCRRATARSSSSRRRTSCRARRRHVVGTRTVSVRCRNVCRSSLLRRPLTQTVSRSVLCSTNWHSVALTVRTGDVARTFWAAAAAQQRHASGSIRATTR